MQLATRREHEQYREALKKFFAELRAKDADGRIISNMPLATEESLSLAETELFPTWIIHTNTVKNRSEKSIEPIKINNQRTKIASCS